MFIEMSSIIKTLGIGEGSSEEEEEELDSLDFHLASQQSLLPWSLPKVLFLPTYSILDHGGQNLSLYILRIWRPWPQYGVTGNIIVQIRAEGELPAPQTFIVTQTPLNRNTPGTASGTVLNAPSPFVAASAMEQLMPATSVVGTLVSTRSWYPSLQVPPPSTKLASIFPQVKSQSGLHSSSREEGLATTQSRPSLDDSSCNSKSVYENYRRWQCFNPLARRHHPQSPDTEALSCFLIPVMRSLAQLKPSMTLEEGLWWSVKEWQGKSNFDRMIYYEMAGKFMEFEAEEEMQIQKLQQRNGSARLPPPVPQKFHPPKTSDTVTGQHPGMATQVVTGAKDQRSKETGSAKTLPHKKQQHRSKCTWELKAPKKIPPEAMKEYAEIMEDLLGLAYSANGEPNARQTEDNEHQQEEHDIYTDPGLLNYIDKLCSQEAFVTKVVEVIHPQFLEMLLSPEPQADPLSLIQELEQEEGLTHTQLMKKRLLKLRGEENVLEALPSYIVLHMDSNCPESEIGEGSNEEEEELDSLDFHLASQQSLLPWSLPKVLFLPTYSILDHG
ncbi:PREDICTED: NUT family member 1-like, partial [Chrysochloris asiatica]|uniref:NUT family member 1-like n=1 Tax=Chrysochloris asiatica TaxID=185453 RepID=A0A9B0U8Q2_CHRAS